MSVFSKMLDFLLKAVLPIAEEEPESAPAPEPKAEQEAIVVEWNGLPIALLTDSESYHDNMKWQGFRVTPIAEDMELRNEVMDDEFWRHAQGLYLRIHDSIFRFMPSIQPFYEPEKVGMWIMHRMFDVKTLELETFSESELMAKIGEDWDESTWKRYHQLSAKSNADDLKDRELGELCDLYFQREWIDVKRIFYLKELAKRHGTSLVELREQLKIPWYYAQGDRFFSQNQFDRMRELRDYRGILPRKEHAELAALLDAERVAARARLQHYFELWRKGFNDEP
jgi:hypothetical protein